MSHADPPTKPLQLAFIGAGGVLSHQMKHLKPVPHVQAVAVADVNEGALGCAREHFGIPGGFTDYRRMLKEMPQIDAVSVCTPNWLHAEHSIAALEAGKHVMVEKPMALDARGVRYNEVPPEHGLMVQKMIDAVYESARVGREVAIE